MIALHPVQDNQVIRGCNSSGCGAYGASRGSRDHNGVDILVAPYSELKAPFDGVILRKDFKVYSYPTRQALVGIEYASDDGYEEKMFYATTHLPIGYRFKAGEVIAQAQDMAQYYGDDMPNHVHKEIRDPNGVLQDFTDWFTTPAGGGSTVLFLGIVAAAIYAYKKYKS